MGYTLVANSDLYIKGMQEQGEATCCIPSCRSFLVLWCLNFHDFQRLISRGTSTTHRICSGSPMGPKVVKKIFFFEFFQHHFNEARFEFVSPQRSERAQTRVSFETRTGSKGGNNTFFQEGPFLHVDP